MRLTRLLLSKNPRIPNQKPASLWQDPIFGYFETAGKMEFKPGEEYDLTDKQKQEVMDRYVKKERLKRQYIEMNYNPQRFNYIEGIIMDPAIFRWYATDMSHTERFRSTPRTVLVMIGGAYLLWWIFHKYSINPMKTLDAKSEKGEVLWWDRRVRYFTQGNSGKASTGCLGG